MIVRPKIRGFLCTTAHPQGCAANVQQQIDYIEAQPKAGKGPSRVLVIGASNGYGLASRITAAFGYGADTLGVFFERPADTKKKRPASAGWYNSVAFEEKARAKGLYAKSINGDAFSNELKQQTIEEIKSSMKSVDLVIYSLASPRRTHPDTGINYASVLKPIEKKYECKTLDVNNCKVTPVSIETASEEEIEHTKIVMGGEDWFMWMKALKEANVLAEDCLTVAYSYRGPKITQSIYGKGTIGGAKDHLEATAPEITELLKDINGKAYASVNKALVTQSSSAIPVMPLYISLLYRVMKDKGIQEGCIEQCYRLFASKLFSGQEPLLDEKGRIRVDDLEMREDVQEEIGKIWDNLDSDNITEITDIEGYKQEFLSLFGFGFEGVDYDADVEIDLKLT